MSKQANLILTVDYELFGDGSGRVDRCVTRPTTVIRTVAERYEAPLTLFVEALEFIAMERDAVSFGQVEAVKEQLIDMVSTSHDAQLHIHPQWWGESPEEGKWHLDLSRWRIGDLDVESVSQMIREAKQWLEALLRPVDSSYHCHLFRAGGWCIQPSTTVIRELIRQGFSADSTVAPGLRNANGGEWWDFRSSPHKPSWMIDSDVCRESEQGIREIPIATGRVNPLVHLKAVKRARAAGEGGMADGCCGSYRGPSGRIESIRGKLHKLLRLGHVMLDFSTMPVDVLMEITMQCIARFPDSEYPIPIVAIAHTKNFTAYSQENLCEYLDWAANNNIAFSTYGQWEKGLGE